VTAVAICAAVVLAACGSSKPGSSSPTTAGPSASPPGTGPLAAAQLSLVAYSTAQAPYDQIIKAFQATPQGRDITFTESFGASADQSRAVESGLQADIVALSSEPDMTRLVKDGIVGPAWNAGPHGGMVTDSVVTLVVRKGNPKSIQAWADLTRPGVQVITPNPFTSGGGRWNVLAAYGATSNLGKDAAAGVAYLDALFKNVTVQDDSSRGQLQTFLEGKGDAMIGEESDAISAQQHGQALSYITPDQTIRTENPAAITNSKHPEQARAFLAFLYSPEAQRIFVQNGYRPVVSGLISPTQFRTPPGLFTVAQLGGWAKVSARLFDPATGVMAGIEARLGVPTKK
jgi:sulfate transport system substrate-binding protein